MPDLPTGTVTFLLTDIEGSTRLWEQQPEAMKVALARHNAIVAAGVEQHQGVLIKSRGEGDSTFSVFASATEAVAAAWRIQRDLTAEPWPTATPLRVRLALHTGEVEPQEGDYFGTAVNRCARLRDLGHGGQVLLSLATEELVREALPPGVNLKDLGRHRLRGFQRPEQVFQLTHPGLPADFPPLRSLGALPNTLPYSHNPHFVGRKKALAELRKAFRSPERPCVALVGMGGLGKTQLAIEYALTHREDYPGGIFWIHAEDSLHVRNDYAALGRFFDVPEDLPIQERSAQVREALQQLPQPALLLFDNLTEGTDLALLPSFGPVHVLVTTREEWLVRSGFRTFPVSLLDEEAALVLLQTPRPAESAEELATAREIAKRVGYLPLALALVGHHVGRLGLGFVPYRERLQTPDQLLKALEQARRRFIAATGHSGSVFDTMAISYQSLDPLTQSVLATASCFAGRGLSRDLLFEACPGLSPEDYEEALANLRDDSLLTFEKDKSLTLHELVSAFALGQLSDADRRATFASIVVLLTSRLAQANKTSDWKPLHRGIEHCQKAAEWCRGHGVPEGFPELLHEMGVYFFMHSDFLAAVQHFAEGLQVVENRLGRATRQAAVFLRKMGEAEHEQHDYPRALEHVREAFSLASAVLDPNNPEMADYHVSLGYVLKKHGDRLGEPAYFQEALPHYQQALAINEKAGRRAEVATCLNNIGTLLESMGDLEAALDYLGQALQIDQEHYGADHEKVAIRLNNIGRVLGRQGNWEAALEHHRRALAIFEAIYGRPSRPVGISLHWIAQAWWELGQPDEARQSLQEALPVLKRYYEPGHPFWTECKQLLALVEEPENGSRIKTP